jgi:peptidoglycan/LPS O-acetylase OafA/YrhL
MFGKKNAVPVQSNRIQFFDGLRGWAALAVLFTHLMETFPLLEILTVSIASPLVNGELSIRIFFILSGLVLSLGFMKRRDYTSFCASILKRIPRLSIPILFMSLMVLIFMKAGFFFNIPAGELLNHEALNFNYNFEPSILSAIRFSFFDVYWTYELENSYNANLWTIAFEMRGSIVAILILCCFFQIRKKAAPLMLVIPVYLWFINPIYLDFFCGVMLAHIFVNRQDLLEKWRHKIFPQILCVFGLVFFYLLNIFCRIMDLMQMAEFTYIAIGSLLIVVIYINPWAAKFYSMKLSRFLGRISYPLFITHYPVICTLTSYLILTQYEADNNLVTIRITIYTIAASLAVACVFYPVEKLSIFAADKLYRFLSGTPPLPSPGAAVPAGAPAIPVTAAAPAPAPAEVPADPAPAKTGVKAKAAKKAPVTAPAAVPAPKADDAEDPAFALVQPHRRTSRKNTGKSGSN